MKKVIGNVVNNVLNMFLTFFVKNNEGLYERFEEEHVERAYTDDYIEQALDIYTYSSEDIFYTWENVFEDNVLNMFLTFFVKNNEGLYERFEEEHVERAYTDDYIEQALDKCKFKLIGKFDGYSNDIINKKSERILYIVKKQK